MVDEPDKRQRTTRRLLLVTFTPPTQAGGGTARWRSFSEHLRADGWEVDVVSASSRPGRDDPIARAVQPRARTMGVDGILAVVRRITSPLRRLLGVKSLPLSTLWVLRGPLQVRRRLRRRPSVVVATGPPMIGLPVARIGLARSGIPLVTELRDLWASNPAYDAGGSRFLAWVESWVLKESSAVVATTPSAARSIRERYPSHHESIQMIPNGFEASLLGRRSTSPPEGPLTIVHSGTLFPERPIGPLLEVLTEPPFPSTIRLVLHGSMAPRTAREVAGAECDVQVRAPSSWSDAVETIARADAGLVVQSREAGDATAVAAKAYEYLALGKPVLCITDGGATEAQLRDLGADQFCARLDDRESIAAALAALSTGPVPPPIPAHRLADYDRAHLAARVGDLLAETADSGRSGLSHADR